MMPNDYSLCYDWAPAGRLAYRDFLHARQSDTAIRFAIDNQSRPVIATDAELAQRGIEIVSVNREQGYTLLCERAELAATPEDQAGAAQAPAAPAASLAGRFHWGFCDAAISQGQMNAALADLVKQSGNPSLAWSWQQFEQARSQFRRQAYPEALQSVARALEGQGANPGNKNDFRLHFLAGAIRLGSYRNHAPEHVRPSLALSCFVAAARCAERASPAEAGLALLWAGRAAMAAGDADDAVAHTRMSLQLLPGHAVGLYQLARALFLKGSRQEASDALVEAMQADADHALHACGDPVFFARPDFLAGVMRRAVEAYEARHKRVADRYRGALQSLLEYSFLDLPIEDLQLRGLAEIQALPEAAQALAASATLFGYRAASERYLAGFQLLQAVFEEFRAHCVRQLEMKVFQAPRREDYFPAGWSADKLAGNSFPKAGLASGVVSGMSVFLFETTRMTQPFSRGMLESMSEMFVLPLLTAAAIAAAAAAAQAVYREHQRARHAAALAAFEAATQSYKHLVNTRDKEIAELRRMSVPKEFAAPSFAAATQPGSSGAAPDAKQRPSRWARL